MPVLRDAESKLHHLGTITGRSLAVPSRGTTELAVWYLDVAPGTEGAPHTVNKEEIFVVQSGDLAGKLDGEDFTLGTGDALVVPPETPFELGNPGPAPARLVVCTSAGITATMDGMTVEPAWAQ